MKLFIISDIHGYHKRLALALEKFEASQADRLVILGDIYYHGPRNGVKDNYDPKICAELLNPISDKISAVCGNCDAEVDQMISEFRIMPHMLCNVGSKKCLFIHGHHMPSGMKDINIVFSGHTHVERFVEENGIYFINPGSISLPKADHSKNYIIFDGNHLEMRDLDSDEVIVEKDFE